MTDRSTTIAPRRELRFNSIDDVRREALGLAEAERNGELRMTGSWSLGQVFGHLAAWIGYCYDGFPFKTPAPIRWIMRFRKRAALTGRMPAGIRIPGMAAGTAGTDRLTTEDGLARLLTQLKRLESAAPTQPSPLFGPMTHDEWTSLHLRHAELHLGFAHR